MQNAPLDIKTAILRRDHDVTLKSVHFRVEWKEYEVLEEEAKKRKLGPNAYAKQLHREALANYDRRHEALLDQLEALRNQVAALDTMLAKTAALSAGAVAAAAFPPGMATAIPEQMRAQVKGHITEAVREGERISRAFDKGVFKVGALDAATD
ncbi:TPA: hypothetical protein QDC44_006320 [Burkholderia cepacia ATCC 25416]|nr:hypothetical protein [Burkholderia cepacia ATCC 25416]